MTLEHHYNDADGEPAEIVGKVEFGLGLYEAVADAEGGSVGACSLTIKDKAADFYIRGHRMMWDIETAAAADDYAGVTWAGFVAERTFRRGEDMFSDDERTIDAQRHDVNTILDRRLNVGNDCDRPAETAAARVAWLMGTTEMALVESDTTYVDTSDPTPMDAVDYTGQQIRQVLDDCAQQSGRNFFLLWLDSGDGDEPVAIYLWYNLPGVADYATTVQITNDPGDIDPSSGIYPPSQETTLRRDPSRVYSGVYQAYDGGAVYVQRAETSTKFAKRDTTGIAENVKTKAKAISRANRYLSDIDTELDEISTAIVVPKASVNSVMHGHRIQVKFTHLPGYAADYVWMRVKSRTVRTYTVGFYELSLTLTGESLEDTGSSADDTDGDVFATLNRPGTVGDTGLGSELMWGSNGDNPKPGWPTEPTQGLLSIVTDPSPPLAPWPYEAIQVDGDGTLDRIEFMAFTAGILLDDIAHTVTWAILQNGGIIASETQVISGFLKFWGSQQLVVATNVSVSDGDVISASVTSDPPMPYFRVPSGTGGQDERLRIIGGTLA